MIRILHLEDERADAELVQAKLTEAGLAYRITNVRTREAFETALHDGGLDIILADYRLPMYDGMSALGLVQEVCPDVPFIFVSGKLGEEAAIAALTRGATDYVLKENLSRLAPAVQRALKEARNLRERRQAQEASQHYNDLLRAVIEAAPVSIIGMDLEGRVRSVWNPGAEKMLGWSADEVMGKPLPTVPADRREEFKRFQEQIGLGLTLDGVEVRRQRRDGTPIDCCVYASPLHDAQGRVSGNIAVLVDITERKMAEQELEKHHQHLEALVDQRTAELTIAKEQAEAANRSKSDFLARMSHEIRTPLNAMMGLTNIVLKSELTAKQRDYLNKVLIASNNLLVVVKDILDFSKVEAGRLELEQHPFDLDAVMEQLADIFSEQVAEKDLELIFAVGPKVPRQLSGDGDRLAQVLINLIQNAVKFTESGEIVVGVEQETQPFKDQAQAAFKFWVSDTGTGIAADELPTLFEPFTQAEGYLTRKHEGTGLGLAICRRLVELMGGRIWAESTQGQGSIFAFTVLLETRAEEKPRFSLPVDLQGFKALVVDGSTAARQVLGDLLESFRFDVLLVDSGEKAIETLRRASAGEPYRLLLMDLKMPDMDSIETATAIRNAQDLHPPPIIMVAANERELAQKRIDTTSVDILLMKPIKPSQLFNAIMNYLGRAEAMVPHREQRPAARQVLRLAGRRVLVVEDNALNRDVAVALLEEMGLTVDVAEHGGVAVQKVADSPKGYYDALFMDIQMPVMDGYEATRRIRAREFKAENESTGNRQPTTDHRSPIAGHRIPIIALTAHALKGEKEKCLAADMDDYLAKPLDEHDLRRVIGKWIAP